MRGSPVPTLAEVEQILYVIQYAYGSLRLTRTNEADIHLPLRGHAILWHSILCTLVSLPKRERKIRKTLQEVDHFFQTCFTVIVPQAMLSAQQQGIDVNSEAVVISLRYPIDMLALFRHTLNHVKESMQQHAY